MNTRSKKPQDGKTLGRRQNIPKTGRRYKTFEEYSIFNKKSN